MNLSKTISPAAILTLKEALTHIYWTKRDLRQFIELTIENKSIISTLNWEKTKYETISELIDRMVKRQDIYQDDLLKLVREVGNFNNFSHLEYWEDSKKLIKKANESVKNLREQTKGYFDSLEELKKVEERKEINKEVQKANIAYQQKIEELKNTFLQIASNTNAQQRGFQFEKFLYELFYFFDLNPKSSFKINGEQIDGGFTFDGTDYLLEAKWQQNEIRASDLYSFGAKIASRLKNTLGLFISLGNYSNECINNNPITKSMILMDGMEIMQVLDGRIKLDELILIKRRIASQTGNIYHKVYV